MKIVGADGATWKVSHRVLPRRPSLRRAMELDPSGLASEVIGNYSAILGLVATFLLPVVFVLMILSGEVLLMLLLLPVALLLRIVFNRPWVVEVRRNGELDHIELVRGWTAAERRVAAIADRIRAVGGRGGISKSRYDGF